MLYLDIPDQEDFGLARAWLDDLEEKHGINIVLEQVTTARALGDQLQYYVDNSGLLTRANQVWQTAYGLHGDYLNEDGIDTSHFEKIEGLADFTDLKLFAIDGIDTLDREDAVCGEFLESDSSPISSCEIAMNVAFIDTAWLFEDGRNQKLYDYAEKGMFTYYTPFGNSFLLGQELMHGLCSFIEGEKRIAWVVSFRVDPQGNFTIDSVKRGWAKSTKSFSYFDLTLDEASAGEYAESYAAVKEAALRLRRKGLGREDDDGVHDGNASRIFIAECMTAAYAGFAEWLDERKIPFAHRVHKFPTEPEREKLHDLISAKGIEVTPEDLIDSDKFCALYNMLGEVGERGLQRIMIMVYFGQAHFQAKEGQHMGLNVPRYARTKGATCPGILSHIQAEDARFTVEQVERFCDRANRKQAKKQEIQFIFYRLASIATALQDVGNLFSATVKEVRDDELILKLPQYPFASKVKLNITQREKLAAQSGTGSAAGRNVEVRLTGYHLDTNELRFSLR